MDLLSQRYANPYLILDDFIRSKQLHEFATETMCIIAEEKISKTRWEYYLHKVFDMTYEEYLNACETDQKPQKEQVMKKEEAVEIITSSNCILDNFDM